LKGANVEIKRLFVAACIAAGLLIGGCSSTEPSSPKETPKDTQTPKSPETPKAPAAPTVAPATPEAPAAPQSAKGFVLRVNCGAVDAYKDPEGNVWQADQEMETGKSWGADYGMTVDREGVGVTGTKITPVYECERYSMDDYRFTVPNGKYTVRLHFAETYEGIMGAGERVFSVSIQGQTVMKDFDPFKTADGALKPVVKEFKGVLVDKGQLVIAFTPNIENPEINGIEILGE
jgi:hypothetical protein